MSIHKILSVLLEYPTADLRPMHAEIRARTCGLDDVDRGRLDAFLAYAAAIDLTDLQAEYVQTFDLTPEHSLHMTHHVFGDDKGRGPALIDLTELYRGHGLEVAASELPDYLPLMLEFADLAPPEVGDRFLADAGRVVGVLAANLERAGSPWAGLVRIAEGLCGRPGGELSCGKVESGQAAPCLAPCGGEME